MPAPPVLKTEHLALKRDVGRAPISPLAAIALVGALLMISVFRLPLLWDSGAPPGSDGGNWLAFAIELFGTKVKAAVAVYPPVFPFLLGLLDMLLPSLHALNILAVASWVFMAVPLFLILERQLGTLLALFFTVAAVMAGYQAEILAFGGYPQLLGSAFLLFSLYWLGAALTEGRTRPLLFSALGGSLAIGTHSLIAVQLASAAGVFAVYFLVQQPIPPKLLAARLIKWIIVAAAFSTPFVPFYVRTAILLAGNPFNPHGWSMSHLDAVLGYVFQESRTFALWSTLFLAAVISLFSAIRNRSSQLLAPTAAALVFGPGLLFLATGEVRNFQLLQVGIVVSLGSFASGVMNGVWVTNLTGQWRPWPGSVVALTSLAVAMVIIMQGQQWAQYSFRAYRGLDTKALEALNWLKQQRPGVVVANSSPNGFIYGWWIEGYARHPAYNAADPRWFIFREEKEQTAVANTLLHADLSPEEARDLAVQHGITYLFLDKSTSIEEARLQLVAWGGDRWRSGADDEVVEKFLRVAEGRRNLKERLRNFIGFGLQAAGFRPAFENERFVILVRQG